MAGRQRTLVTASLLLALAALWGADRRVLAGRQSGDAVVHASVPVQVGSWRATPVPVPARIDSMLPNAALLMRRYLQPGDPPDHTVELAVVSSRDVTAFHNPESCYVGAGWTIVNKNRQPLMVAPGYPPLQAVRLLVQKGDCRMLVLYWYSLADGTPGDVASAHPSRLGLLLSTLRLGRRPALFFRVSTLVDDGEPQAMRRDLRFLAELARSMKH